MDINGILSLILKENHCLIILGVNYLVWGLIQLDKNLDRLIKLHLLQLIILKKLFSLPRNINRERKKRALLIGGIIRLKRWKNLWGKWGKKCNML